MPHEQCKAQQLRYVQPGETLPKEEPSLLQKQPAV